MVFRISRLIVSLFLLWSATSFRHVWAAARRMETTAPDASVDTVEWIRYGVEDKFEVKVFKGEYTLTTEQLARMAEAQLRWQSISQQVCLSRNTGLLCFNWDRSQITLNGESTQHDYPLHFESNQLFVPIKFVTSKTFEKFSRQEFMWNAAALRLTQEEPVTLTIPPIEDLGDRYQLALDVKKSPNYHLLENGPTQIWIRFMRGQTEGSQILEGDNVIKEIRINQKQRSADLIILLGPKAQSHEVYYDQGEKKLTIDIFKSDKAAPTHAFSKKKPVEPSSTKETVVPLVIEPASPKKRDVPPPSSDPKIFTVVIDAGHGGMDPGAIGTRGTFEKDVNLKAARSVRDAFSKHKNIRVVMARERDEFLPLSDRPDLANRVKADMFVSLHCNSSLSSKSSGFEVFILSPDATDQAAEAVARIENSVVALESKKGAEGSRLNELLASMAVHTNINESSKCAGYILRGMKKRTTINTLSVREANFHVLRGAQMPSVLVELGYISHPVSELQLRSSRYLSQVAKGIVDGVLMYQQSLSPSRATR